MKALSLKYSNPVLSQIQGFAIFLRYWVKLLTSISPKTWNCKKTNLHGLSPLLLDQVF